MPCVVFLACVMWSFWVCVMCNFVACVMWGSLPFVKWSFCLSRVMRVCVCCVELFENVLCEFVACVAWDCARCCMRTFRQ